MKHLHNLSHLILTTTLKDSSCYAHFTMRKLKLREVKYVDQGQLASEWLN
jgi:hypothetical protein